MALHQTATVEIEIAHLRRLDLAGLQARWKTATARRAPPHLSKALLIRMLAYRMQADVLGDLDSGTLRFIERIGSGLHLRSGKALPPPDADVVRPGAVLVREWEGASQHVTALADNRFGWNGRTFRSLSEVARAITGTRWNGPRFFGLRTKGAS